MRRVLPPAEFRDWFHKYLPGAAKGEPATLFEPGDRHRPHRPATRSPRRAEPEPGVVHAGHRGGPAEGRPGPEGARPRRRRSTRRPGCKHVASGDYAGEHWLASFAVHMLGTPPQE